MLAVQQSPATAALEAPETLAWKAKGAVSLEVEVMGTEMVRRKLLRCGLLSLACAAAAVASAGLNVNVAPRRRAGRPARTGKGPCNSVCCAYSI